MSISSAVATQTQKSKPEPMASNGLGKCSDFPTDGTRAISDSDIVQFLPALQGYATYLCRDRDAVDDLVHDTVVRALANAHQWKPGTNLKAWLMTIMRNGFLSGVRQVRGHRFVTLDGDDQSLTISYSHDDRFELIDVARAWARLRADHREILAQLCRSHHYSDIAAHYRIPMGTVRSRVSRARQALREEMERKVPAV